MNTILEQYKDKINGTFSFFDRMIIKGHIRQFFSPLKCYNKVVTGVANKIYYSNKGVSYYATCL